MRIKFIFILIYLFVNLLCKAQIQFVDDYNKLPIPSLNIYNEKGVLLGFTDKAGIARFLDSDSKRQKKNLRITVQHISYETKTFSLESLDD